MMRTAAYLTFGLIPGAALAISPVTDCAFDVECTEDACTDLETSITVQIVQDVPLGEGGEADAIIVSGAPQLTHVPTPSMRVFVDDVPDLEVGERYYIATSQTAAVQVRDTVLTVGENANKRSEFWRVVIPADEAERAALHVQHMSLFVLPQRTQYTGTCTERPA